jgi:hypothetical protein
MFATSHDNETNPALSVSELKSLSSAESDENSGGGDALIFKNLIGGSVYIIRAANFGETGVFTLTAEYTGREGPSDVRWFPSIGGNAYFELDKPVVAFVPNRSATWEFYINTDYSGWLPRLEITNTDGTQVVTSDGRSDDPWSLLTAELSAGSIYLVYTDFTDDNAGDDYYLVAYYR